VKKVWLVVALVTLGGLTSKTYADVQNIRLSGDIRIRGYYLDNTDPSDQGNESFISQRTRVSVEADLEDHVLVVVTLQAEGEWGANNDSASSNSGAGVANASAISRRWALGVSEAYVQMNEVFYTPATLKLGRQYLNYGHGLILSSVEQEYNYDAARLVLDYYPLTIDLVGAEIVNNAAFGPGDSHGGSDLLFVNARYEMTDSVIKNVEAYFGWLSQASAGSGANTRVPPSNGAADASPWIIGARTDLQPSNGFQIWAEGAYEGGADGSPGVAAKNISAGLLNLGGRFTMKDTQWSPAINANYIYATGGGQNGEGNFRPWFDYADGYNGYLFCPALSNIQIFNVGASVKPYENTTLSLQGYYYLKADSDTTAGSNANVDFGGLATGATGPSSGIGWEFDGIVGYDYSKDVRLQLVYGVFVPGGAYQKAGDSVTSQEVRGEVNVKF